MSRMLKSLVPKFRPEQLPIKKNRQKAGPHEAENDSTSLLRNSRQGTFGVPAVFCAVCSMATVSLIIIPKFQDDPSHFRSYEIMCVFTYNCSQKRQSGADVLNT